MEDMARPRTPAYERIADDLAARIQAGEFARDVSLPGAGELAEQYHCSRRTAWRAVQELAARDLVIIKPSYGTFLK
jgi:GntR family transcriptional regulator